LPTFDPAYHEAAIAVLTGAQLQLAPGAPPRDSPRWLNRCYWPTPPRARGSPRSTTPSWACAVKHRLSAVHPSRPRAPAVPPDDCEFPAPRLNPARQQLLP
jgi:hypothetical protein